LGILLVIVLAGYFIGQSMIRKKVVEALRGLPPAFAVSCSSINPGLFTGSLVISDLKVRFTPGPDSLHWHEASCDRLAIHGIGYFGLVFSHRLQIRVVRMEGCRTDLDDYLLEKKIPFPKMQGQGEPPFTEATIDKFELADLVARTRRHRDGEAHKKAAEVNKNDAEVNKKDADVNKKDADAQKSKELVKDEPMDDDGEIKEEHHERGETVYFEGSLTVHSIHLNDINQPIDTANMHFGDVRLDAGDLRYKIGGAYQKLRLSNIAFNSQDSSLRIDTTRIYPTLDPTKVGKLKGIQTDVVEGISEGIEVNGLDFMALLRHRLTASAITIKRNNLHIFRDRRLPRDEGVKQMPVDFLKGLPVTLRVRSVKFGPTNFSYEEFPSKGDKPGILRIVGLTGTLKPLINHPVEGDPAYITMVSTGSLMGSGTVTATTKMPLHKGDPYQVEGAFHELDVTTLNGPAENLGLIHLQSGMLNLLAFQFEMTDEKSTGKIVGEYHNLVVQKMKEKNDVKKIDKIKSFALKEFIIPLNKDKSMPESKRTGKVDYKHDPSRMFSYYLLHSLLVGVKKSFALGFLLPG
jgi:hypothetical protein